VASDLAEQLPSARFASSNFGYSGPIPDNPYTGLSYQTHPNVPFWPYPLYNKPTITDSADVKDFAATSPDSRQQKIACGVGPASPPQRTTPTVSIVGGSQAIPNSWPFIVSFDYYFFLVNENLTYGRATIVGLFVVEFLYSR
jgi:hypothetical protein